MTWDTFNKLQNEKRERGEHKTYVQCPKCDSYLYLDTTRTIMSMPPKHRYFCKECGWEEYA